MKARQWLFVGLALAAGVCALCVLWPVTPGQDTAAQSETALDDDVAAGRSAQIAEVEPAAVETAEIPAEEEVEPPLTDEERRVAEEEKRIETFETMTDQWMEGTPAGVTMDDVNQFVCAFDALPQDRKEECLQRALNLIPDENVMLLVGILMDKRQNRDLVVMVFNDILNRDESVKQPILERVYQDKTHPCWEDVAWIYSVTK